MPTTEIVNMPLKAGSNIGDPKDPSAAVVKSMGATLARQDGFQELFFGTGLENPSLLQFLITWDSKAKHEQFMASSEYGPFFESVKKIVDGEVTMWHVDFTPAGALTKTLSAPFTELTTFYFDGEVPADYGEGASKVGAIFTKGAEGVEAFSWGPTHEVLESKGVKGKAVTLAVGWSSIEAHMKLRDSDLFRDNIHLLRNSAKVHEMHHIQALKYLG